MTTQPNMQSTPEATPVRAAMSEEIILTDGVDLQNWRNEITRLRAIIAERDAEIARLRRWLEIIAAADESDESWWYTGRAERALTGEAVPDDR